MVNIKEFYPNDALPSVADVTVNEEVVEVRFWGSYTRNFTQSGELNIFLQAEALKKLGKIEEAKNLLSAVATGEVIITEEDVDVDGRIFHKVERFDDRNWAQVWIDKN